MSKYLARRSNAGIRDIEFHRNGSEGAPFYAILLDVSSGHSKGHYLIQASYEGNPTTPVLRADEGVAFTVIDLDKALAGNIRCWALPGQPGTGDATKSGPAFEGEYRDLITDAYLAKERNQAGAL